MRDAKCPKTPRNRERRAGDFWQSGSSHCWPSWDWLRSFPASACSFHPFESGLRFRKSPPHFNRFALSKAWPRTNGSSSNLKRCEAAGGTEWCSSAGFGFNAMAAAPTRFAFFRPSVLTKVAVSIGKPINRNSLVLVTAGRSTPTENANRALRDVPWIL